MSSAHYVQRARNLLIDTRAVCLTCLTFGINKLGLRRSSGLEEVPAPVGVAVAEMTPARAH